MGFEGAVSAESNRCVVNAGRVTGGAVERGGGLVTCSIAGDPPCLFGGRADEDPLSYLVPCLRVETLFFSFDRVRVVFGLGV